MRRRAPGLGAGWFRSNTNVRRLTWAARMQAACYNSASNSRHLGKQNRRGETPRRFHQHNSPQNQGVMVAPSVARCTCMSLSLTAELVNRADEVKVALAKAAIRLDRKSTRLNSSHRT